MPENEFSVHLLAVVKDVKISCKNYFRMTKSVYRTNPD